MLTAALEALQFQAELGKCALLSGGEVCHLKVVGGLQETGSGVWLLMVKSQRGPTVRFDHGGQLSRRLLGAQVHLATGQSSVAAISGVGEGP